ncbi:MAG: hypothetical protein QW051_05075, partial [Candidatus Aenigmatarchaeota archaeon]
MKLKILFLLNSFFLLSAPRLSFTFSQSLVDDWKQGEAAVSKSGYCQRKEPLVAAPFRVRKTNNLVGAPFRVRVVAHRWVMLRCGYKCMITQAKACGYHCV